ncbi:MAG: hypothetical protein M3Z10_05280 [Gemmatimonadota bacterium]|nr:hypothetical protein [Gemmatimonadota bacterium]
MIADIAIEPILLAVLVGLIVLFALLEQALLARRVMRVARVRSRSARAGLQLLEKLCAGGWSLHSLSVLLCTFLPAVLGPLASRGIEQDGVLPVVCHVLSLEFAPARERE